MEEQVIWFVQFSKQQGVRYRGEERKWEGDRPTYALKLERKESTKRCENAVTHDLFQRSYSVSSLN